MNERLYSEIKKAIETGEPYPGYPSVRYVVNPAEIPADGTLTIPEGPWEMNNTDLPSAEDTERFVQAGYQVDQHGRPLHPHLIDMVTDPAVGIVSGRGRYWNWGPNFTADPVVITKTAQPRVLLIQRDDTGSWALPGGFVDPTDTDVSTAARRELMEEAGLAINSDATEVYTGVVGDRRTTAHAWAETGAYLLQLDRQVPVSGMDDATDAKWVRLDKLEGTLFGSHNFLIEEAVKRAEFERKKSIVEILSEPREQLDVEIVDAGHMAYDHMFVRDENSCLFVKEHVAERFTDALREAHSRQYLEKEFESYEYVAERGFSHIPDRVDLVDDSLLAMDALRIEDGWIWEAPEIEDATYHRYVNSVLTAFDQLQLVPIPANPTYHEVINPTYETFWREGWDDVSDEKIEPLIEKIQYLSANWSDARRQTTEELIADFAYLRDYADTIERNVTLFMAHNDARQSNIAEHPELGAALVDWSWGDPAPKNADATMFLVDLVKSGHDVTPYLAYVNKDQLVLLIGFWLAHSLWNTRDGSSTVREQQVASATAAYRLLRQIDASEKTAK